MQREGAVAAAAATEADDRDHGALARWLCHLEALHPRGQAGIELGLERVAAVRDRLAQVPVVPVITVGGTNGKGSVCAYLEHILAFAGYRVGCYTSPHLLRYNERVRVDRVPLDDAALCAAFARVEAARIRPTEVPLTYFEFGTLAAWEAFVQAGVDVIILEVGLGGRLDAVNAYDADCALVTGIALDHTDWLGPTREHIGFEKAGIFRPGRPALCGDPEPPSSLRDHAAAIGADLQILGRDFGYFGDRTQWTWWGRKVPPAADGSVQRRGGLAAPGLRGTRQLGNAALVLAALDTLRSRLPVDMQAIRRGLIEVELAGRCQVLPGRPSLVLDVAHNPQAVAALAESLGDMGFAPRTHAVVGMLADKDIEAALRELSGKVDHWYVAGLDVPRAAPVARIEAAARAAGGGVSCHPDPAAALAAAQSAAGEDDRILVLGSFHTVAAAMQTLSRRTLSGSCAPMPAPASRG